MDLKKFLDMIIELAQDRPVCLNQEEKEYFKECCKEVSK